MPIADGDVTDRLRECVVLTLRQNDRLKLECDACFQLDLASCISAWSVMLVCSWIWPRVFQPGV